MGASAQVRKIALDPRHECAAVQLNPRCSRRLLRRVARRDPRLSRYGCVAKLAIQSQG